MARCPNVVELTVGIRIGTINVEVPCVPYQAGRSMFTLSDLLAAKRSLSNSLLDAGLRGQVIGRVAAATVANAIASTDRNVHAIGIGRKLVHGKPTGDLCIRVYVVQKLAPSLIPPIFRIPAMIAGISTDVIESPPAFANAKKSASPAKPTKKAKAAAATPVAAAAGSCSVNRQLEQRPVVAGISAGHFQITAGTIGCFCRSTRPADNPAEVYLLSNNHVFANVNQATVGDDIYQPGPADGGTSVQSVARLARFVPLELGGVRINHVDAAIARLVNGIAHTSQICMIGAVAGVAVGTQGTAVKKHGRTSGFTEGVITDESYDALVGMDHSNPSVVAKFEDQIRIELVAPYSAFGLGGDSGSLVVNGSNQAVGLYFAGPPGGYYGIASPIAEVLSALEIAIL